MINNIFLISFIVFAHINLFGQQYNAEVLNGVTYRELDKKFVEYEVFEFNTHTMWSVLMNSQKVKVLTLGIGIELSVTINLKSTDLIGNEYYDSHRKRFSSGVLPTPYKGWIKESNNSDIRLSIGNNFIQGYIRNGDKVWYIEPIAFYDKNLKHNRYILYDASSTPELVDFCGTEVDSRFDIHSNFEQTCTATCQQVDIAIANDYSMVQRYGSSSAVESRNIAVMNVTQGYYTSVFSADIVFKIVSQFVSHCSDCDPWTSSRDVSTVLTSFINWGISGGFGLPYDIGQLWSNQEFDRHTGYASGIGTFCGPFNYNVCQSQNNEVTSAVLSAHEIGHNIGLNHDPHNTNFIMSPIFHENPTSWSASSIYQGNSFISSLVGSSCLEACEGGNPPVSSFGVDQTVICEGSTVHFFDESTENPSKWSWKFEGGNPASAHRQNPIITYTLPGSYDVSLISCNSYGTHASTFQDFILVQDFPLASFTYESDNLTVNFANDSQNWNDLFWDFGDGNFSNLTNPNHSYQQSGTYVVNLKASNQCGEDEYMESLNVSVVVTATSDNQVKGISVFPNPTTQHFFLKGNGISRLQGILQLIDFNGKIQRHYNLSDMAGDKFSLVGVSPGLYLILLKLKDGQFITHILVE